MRAYEKLASKVALIICVATLVFSIIARHIPYYNLPLNVELLLAIIISGISFFIMIWLPKLIMPEKSLNGLYLIIYSKEENKLCSVVNIEYNSARLGYSIEFYDCYQKGSEWWALEGQYPASFDSVYYDLQHEGKKFHLISNDENKKSCLFIRFFNKNKAKILRYGYVKPFNKPIEGDLYKLSSGNLCKVYNNEYNNTDFCNMMLDKHEICKAKKRLNCYKSANDILSWVRNKSQYLEIPKHLYDEFFLNQERVGSLPAKSKAVRNKKE